MLGEVAQVGDLRAGEAGRPDILPVGDQGIRNAIKAQYRLRKIPDAKRMEKIAKPWRPYRTLACLYLWSSLDNTPG